jgi:hypothetical protein
MLNYYKMFVCVLQRIYYRVYLLLNYYGTSVRVLRRVELLRYSECQIVMNRLNKHFKGYIIML